MISRFFAATLLLISVLTEPECEAWQLTEDVPPDSRDVAQALDILGTWLNESDAAPGPSEPLLHLVCWTPSDRELPTDWEARLSRIMLHIQDFYSQEMERHGFGPRSFNLQAVSENRLKLHVATGEHPFRHYNGQSSQPILRDCQKVLRQAGIDPDDGTVMIFCNLATWNESELTFRHDSPYYAGGSARGGVAWQLDSPELDTKNLGLTRPMIRGRQYGRVSLGKHNSIFIGGIAHELGHALGLPHNRERRDESEYGAALMGHGNQTFGDEIRGESRGSFLTFAHALRLASHPQFSGHSRGLDEDPHSEIDSLSLKVEENQISVSGRVVGSPPVYGVVAYFDPIGSSDYDATTQTSIPDHEGNFELTWEPQFRSQRARLRLVVLHVNGLVTESSACGAYRYPFEVQADGSINIDAALARIELGPLIEAVRRGDLELAGKIVENLKSETALSIAHALTERGIAGTPAEYPENESSASLSLFRPHAVQVGWAQPSYNRIPGPSMLLESTGKLYSRGIFAHAPALHEYELGGKWNSFSGQAGIAEGQRGTVRFEVLGDGKRLWISEAVTPDDVVSFDVPVADVNRLTLRTHTTADGGSGDWGLWLAPRLER